MRTPPTTLLLGSGYTLTRLAAALPIGGFVLTSRHHDRVAGWQQRGLHAVRADSAAAPDLAAACAAFPSVSTVIDSVPPPRDQGVEELFASAQRRGELFKSAGIGRVVYLSTTGVFGVDDGSVVDEMTPSKPRNPWAEARDAVERGYTASGVATTAVRIPAIYGPGRGLGLALRHGSMKLIDKGDRWTNRVHVTDLVAYLKALITAPTVPPVVCVGDATPALQREVVEFYAQKFGLPIPPSISLEQARAAGLYTQLGNQRVDSSKTRALLGIALAYPSYREGAGSEFLPDLDPL